MVNALANLEIRIIVKKKLGEIFEKLQIFDKDKRILEKIQYSISDLKVFV